MEAVFLCPNVLPTLFVSIKNTKMKLILAYLFLIACIFACEPCAAVKCSYSMSYFNVSFLDDSTQQDLYFDSASTYNFDSLKIYSIQGEDSIFYAVSKNFVNNQDSVLSFQTFDVVETLFVQFSATDIDTIHLSYADQSSECCPDSKELHQLLYKQKPYKLQGVLRFSK